MFRYLWEMFFLQRYDAPTLSQILDLNHLTDSDSQLVQRQTPPRGCKTKNTTSGTPQQSEKTKPPATKSVTPEKSVSPVEKPVNISMFFVQGAPYIRKSSLC